jgi:TolA-binding protein
MSLFDSRRAVGRCPSALELTVAISNGPDATLSFHLGACAACAARWRELGRPGELARALPSAAPSAAELEQSRTRLLIAFAEERSRSPSAGARLRGRTAAAIAVSIAAAVAIVAWPAPRQPAPIARRAGEIEFQTPHATVRARAGASYERQGSAANDVVRLRDGTARFDVRPLATRERFRVVTGNGEVEVRGTSFQVTVAGDRLAAVHVEHGRVEVRAEGRGVMVLGPGDDWTAGPQSAGRTSAAAAPTAAEVAFVEGWDAFRSGRLVGAIEAFDDVLRLDPGGSLAEDARYWKAVARARTGSRSAADELESFVRDYPASPHANDARLLRESLRAPDRPDTTSRRMSP